MAISTDTIRPGLDGQTHVALVAKSGETIYAGSFVAIGGPGHADAGYAFKYVPDVANVIPVGFATKNVVGDGTKLVPVKIGGGILRAITVAGVAGSIADVGKEVYLTDDGTFTVAAQTSGNRRHIVGIITRYVTATTFDVLTYSFTDNLLRYSGAGGELTPVGNGHIELLKVSVTGANVTTGGGLAAIANKWGAEVVIVRCALQRTTKSTGAAAADIGVAADATTSSDILIDGVALGATEATEDNVSDGGTNGKARQKWGSTQFVTMTGAADSTGLVAKLWIEVFVP